MWSAVNKTRLRRGINVTLLLPGGQSVVMSRSRILLILASTFILFCFALLEWVELFHLVRQAPRWGTRCSRVVSVGLDAVNFESQAAQHFLQKIFACFRYAFLSQASNKSSFSCFLLRLRSWEFPSVSWCDPPQRHCKCHGSVYLDAACSVGAGAGVTQALCGSGF